jgi:succinate dehydrogenase/fumarate reductase flavoprotein subunit
MLYHPDYILLLTRLFENACQARAWAEVADTYEAIKHLHMASVYLRQVYHIAPPQVTSYVNRKLQEIMGDGTTISKYFEHLGRACDSIQTLDMRARDKQDLCNREYAAALDILFMIVGEALNVAGVFKLSAVEERRVRA